MGGGGIYGGDKGGMVGSRGDLDDNANRIRVGFNESLWELKSVL